MVVANKIRTKDWQTVNVILDFKECQVIKSTVSGQLATKDWDTLVGYYYPFYTNIMERLFEENGHAAPVVAEEAPKVSSD